MLLLFFSENFHFLCKIFSIFELACFRNLNAMLSKYFAESIAASAVNWEKFIKYSTSLHKHIYSNILKISPPKPENFQIKTDIFHISSQKYRLWILVRTTSTRRFLRVRQLFFFFEQKYKKIMYTPVNPSFTI